MQQLSAWNYLSIGALIVSLGTVVPCAHLTAGVGDSTSVTGNPTPTVVDSMSLGLRTQGQASHGQENQDTIDEIGLVGVPYITYAPETQIKLGVAGVMSMHLDPRSELNRRASTLSLGLSVTQLKQFSAVVKFDAYFNHVRSRISGRIAFERMPNRFFGYGPYSVQEDEVWYRPDNIKVELMYFHQVVKTEVGQGLTLGGRLEHWTANMQGAIPVPPGGSTEPVGWRGGVSTGIGLVGTYDTRDNAYYPTMNEYVEARTIQYVGVLGGTFTYNRTYLDMRKFVGFKLGDNTGVVGAQVIWDATFGNAPFYDTPTYGGADKMRGILAGRYVDHSSIAGQIEVHSRLFWIVGAAAFIGAGDVAPSVDRHSLGHLKVAGGAGLRAYLNQENGLIGRIDVGFSEWGTGLYITFAEAF